MRAESPQIKSIQVCSPPEELRGYRTAIQPAWSVRQRMEECPTAMVLLKPGQSTAWRVRLEMFTPAK